jgi:hypothetical protein
MKLRNMIAFTMTSFAAFSGSAWAYGTGYSSFPLSLEKRLLSTEITGITSTGGGLGVQARYTQKANEQLSFDAGIGMGAGERTGRLFGNADFEIFPDYMKQPRVAIRAGYEYAKEFDDGRNIFTVAPTVSKGFSFWGNEAFPFVSLPVGMNLNGDTKTYESTVAMNAGITGHLPIDGYQNLIGLAEMQVGLKDSFTALFFGVSYPLN